METQAVEPTPPARSSGPPAPEPPTGPGGRPRAHAGGGGGGAGLAEVGLIGVVLVLGVILTYFGWANALPGRSNTFLSFDNLVEGVAAPMSIYAIMALGMTCVIITGGIDISVGSVMALAALGGAWALQRLPPDASAAAALPVAAGVTCGIGLACGLVNGLCVVGLRMHPFIVTLGTMSVFRGLATVLPPQATLPVPPRSLPAAFTDHFMRLELYGLRATPLLTMLACALVAWVFLAWTVMGRQTYAVGSNETAARFSGLRVGAIKLRVYAISGLCAGIAGMVSLGRFGTASTNTAMGYELMVVAAAVVGGASLAGGRGTALGALLGTLVIAMIENGILIVKLNMEYRLVIIGGAIIAAVALERAGEALRVRRAAAAAAAAHRAG